MTNTPGWAIMLEGDKIDIEDLKQMLPSPFDPSVESYFTDEGERAILRSKSWSGVTDVSVIYGDAARILERLHGTMRLIHADAAPVKPGIAMRFDANGERENVLFPVTGNINVTLGAARARAYATTGQPGGSVESEVQEWFQRAETDDLREELFRQLSRLDDWFDLYKSMELARHIANEKFKSILGADEQKWGGIRQTANHHRHAPTGTYPLPNPVPKFEEAREFVLKKVAKILRAL